MGQVNQIIDEPPAISVVVVSYNTVDLLDECLSSIREYALPLGAEAIVVDNGSRDGSAKMVKERHPWVRLIENPHNRFFTGGVNQAVEIARGEYLLFFNSDARLIDGSLGDLTAFLDANPDCGGVEGVTIDDQDGGPSWTAWRFSSFFGEVARFSFLGKWVRRTSWYSLRHYAHRDPFGAWSAEVACNCFLLFRSELFRSMGGADESMFLYYSEDDWARRLYRMGKYEFHIGSTAARHAWRSSSRQVDPIRLEAIFCHDRYIYLKKHHGFLAAIAVTAAILLRPNLIRSFHVLMAWLRLPHRLPSPEKAGFQCNSTG